MAWLFAAGGRRHGRRVRLGELVPPGNVSPSCDGNGYRPSAQRPHRLRVQLRRKGPKIYGILGTLSRRCARWVAFSRDLPPSDPTTSQPGDPAGAVLGGALFIVLVPVLFGVLVPSAPAAVSCNPPRPEAGPAAWRFAFVLDEHVREVIRARRPRRRRRRTQPGGRGPSICCASTPARARGRRKPSNNG